MKYLTFGAVAALGFASQAQALCTSYPNTLTNGTTADGGQVMANFNCAALTSGATMNGVTFTGATNFPGSTIIDTTGYMGIGTTAGVPLDIGGSIASSGLTARIRNASSTGYSDLRLPNDQNSIFRMLEIDYSGSAYSGALVTGGPTGESASIATTGAYPLTFATGNTFRGMFASDGSFLIGTTSKNISGVKTEFDNSTNNVGFYMSGNVNAAAAYFRIDYTTPQFVDFLYGAGTQVGSISTNGSSTSYNTTSDERLKNWTVPQRNYGAAIRSLWVGDFAWKANGRTDFGIRAQQAYPLFPSAIHKPDTATGQWQADYSKLAPLALWGVKDLYRSSDSQNTRISTLEHEISALRQVNDADQAEIRLLKAQISVATIRLQTQVSELQRRAGVRTASN